MIRKLLSLFKPRKPALQRLQLNADDIWHLSEILESYGIPDNTKIDFEWLEEGDAEDAFDYCMLFDSLNAEAGLYAIIRWGEESGGCAAGPLNKEVAEREEE